MPEDDVPPVPLQPLLTIGGVDGAPSVEVFLAEDEMLAWGNFNPSFQDHPSHLLVYQEIEEALVNAGIVFGINTRGIQEAIFQCNMEKESLRQIVLARGKEAKGARPAFLKLEAAIYDHHFAPQTEVSVDYKDYTPFIIVKKGELLARAVKPREGIPGSTVTGKELPPGKKEIKILKPGPQTLFAHGKVFARHAGRFFIEGDVFDISDTLEVVAGVNYSTGHLVFPGNIVISGVVKDGFRIVAGGSLTVKDTLDASEVMCKKDLDCASGIIGKKPGLLRVGGQVEALFVENCQIEALGNVRVGKNILHSRIFSDGRVELDEGGKIVASSIHALESVVCSQLGNETGGCHVTVGSDFVVARKIEALRAHYKEEESHLHKLRARLEEAGSSRIQELEKEIREKLARMVSEINELTSHLWFPGDCRLEVSGEIFPGTVIEMGYARLPVTARMKSKVFQLSPDKKNILVDKLKGS